VFTSEQLAKIAVWRARSDEGTITLDEQREFIIMLRGQRRAAITEGKSGRSSRSAPSGISRSKKAPVNTDDLLKELEGL